MYMTGFGSGVRVRPNHEPISLLNFEVGQPQPGATPTITSINTPRH